MSGAKRRLHGTSGAVVRIVPKIGFPPSVSSAVLTSVCIIEMPKSATPPATSQPPTTTALHSTGEPHVPATFTLYSVPSFSTRRLGVFKSLCTTAGSILCSQFTGAGTGGCPGIRYGARGKR